ncbi:hypothetical protein AGMMS4957_17280 [Bacteroidia bacterium]|nr:hypothetical protein AGMMS4957_17280 [Bacteroidia bacterium]
MVKSNLVIELNKIWRVLKIHKRVGKFFKNKKNMKTLLFGAGASVPFFCPQLSTNYLTEQISKSCNWEKIVTRYNAKKKADDKQNDSPDSNGLLLDSAEIVALIGNIGKQNPNYNFENIAEIIDELSYYGFNDKLTDDEKQNCGNLSSKYNVKPVFAWKIYPLLFRLIIAESILELQEEKHQVDSYDELIELQKNFIDSFIGKDKGTIFSTNYDDLLLNSVKDLNFELGFGTDSTDDFKRDFLKPCTLLNAQRAICFPHSHLRLVFIGKEDGMAHYISDSKQANDYIWANLFSTDLKQILPVTLGTKRFNFNTSSVGTGATKTDMFNFSPYFDYNEKMESDIKQCSDLIIIGYSFNDEHINKILKTCPAKKITVVDYKQGEDIGKFKDNIATKCDNISSLATFYLEGYDKYLKENIYSKRTTF